LPGLRQERFQNRADGHRTIAPHADEGRVRQLALGRISDDAKSNEG